MKFVCLGYIDASMWENLPKEEAQKAMEDCMAYDNELRQGGNFAGGGALSAPQNGVTLRHQDGQVSVTDGPFIETKEQIGGILLLEARDLNHAIQLMSKHPGVRMGPFEIRPADEAMNLQILEISERLAKEANSS